MILGIDHIGIAVHDALVAADVFADLIAHVGSHVEEVAGQAVRVAFVPETWPEGAGTRVEILAPADPTDPSGAVARFLERRGEGLHHVCFLTDDIDGEIARLAPRYAMVDTVPRRGHGGRVAFLHPKGAHGVLVELIERDAFPALDTASPFGNAQPGLAPPPSEGSGEPPSFARWSAGHPLAATRSADAAEGSQAARLIADARRGDRRALARALTTVETGGEAGRAVAEASARIVSGPMVVVGVTGAPGAGKSTLVGALAKAWREADAQSLVAVLAIDPSSPVTGGAVLGDRVRMGGVAGDAGVFVRSVAGRGAGDGLADAAWDMLSVLRGAAFGTVFLETVGAGQDALAIGSLADVVVVVHAPGLGDSIQGLKSGLVELADVIVVNKADLDGAAAMASGLRFGRGDDAGCPVMETVATTGAGIADLRAAVADAAKRPRDPEARARRAISRAAMAVVRTRVRAAIGDPEAGSELVRAVIADQMSPMDAAYVILGGTASHGVRRPEDATTSRTSHADAREGSQG